jgi:hypothetical protein
MNRPGETEPNMQPSVAEMLQNYLKRQAALVDDPLADLSGGVVPFDSSALPPVDVRRAWEEGLSAARFLAPNSSLKFAMPPDWPALVSVYDSTGAWTFALGNSPQFVRNIQPMLRGEELSSLRPGKARTVPAPALMDWVAKVECEPPGSNIVLALSCLRLGRHFERALQLVDRCDRDIPNALQQLWSNEVAALAWHAGNADKALEHWQTQAASVPIHFNRGMALLFTGHPVEARPSLAQAVAGIAEDDAWHHLACLYLALAELRA